MFFPSQWGFAASAKTLKSPAGVFMLSNGTCEIAVPVKMELW